MYHFLRATISSLIAVGSAFTLHARSDTAPYPVGNSTATASINRLYDFVVGTWLENLSVRPDGQVLVTVLSTPDVYLLPPGSTNNTASKLLHSFPNETSCVGITSPQPDTFFLGVGQFNLTSFVTVPGTYEIWKLKFANSTSNTPAVVKIANIPKAANINGVSFVPNTSNLLLADSSLGLIYRFNTVTLKFETLLNDSTLRPLPNVAIKIGVNGLEISNGYLYFSNSLQAIIARVPIDLDGTPTGPVQVIYSGSAADDFVLSRDGKLIYVAEANTNTISLLDLNGLVGLEGNATIATGTVTRTILFGGGNSTAILGPTALQWGAEDYKDSLFVTSNGGTVQYVDGNLTHGGRVSRIDGL